MLNEQELMREASETGFQKEPVGSRNPAHLQVPASIPIAGVPGAGLSVR
jgi:hypothetical protein